MCGTDIFLLCLSVLFPPIGVWVKRGICSADSLINIALCCLGYLPGLIHAGYIILSYPDEYEQLHDQEGGQGGVVTYYYVQHGTPAPPSGRGSGGAGGQQNYGTVAPSSQFPGQEQSGCQNAFPAPQRQPQQPQQPKPQQPKPQSQPQYKPQSAAPQSAAPGSQPAAGSSDGEQASSQAPPSYADVIKGDHKVQRQD